MSTIKVSNVQFSYKPIKSFDEFASNVTHLVNQSVDSDYIVFPETFTMELHYITPNNDLNTIHMFTEEYTNLFDELAQDKQKYIIAGSHLTKENDKLYNRCTIFCPDGTHWIHDKTHLFPLEAGFVTPGDEFEIFKTERLTFAVATCYEMEFPEVTRMLTLKGAEVIFSPSYTVGEHGFWRVRHCCQARAIENQIYVVHSCMVGTPKLQAMAGWGKSSILSPCEPPWPENGVLTEAKANQEMVISAELDLKLLKKKRRRGAATTLKDRRPELYNY